MKSFSRNFSWNWFFIHQYYTTSLETGVYFLRAFLTFESCQVFEIKAELSISKKPLKFEIEPLVPPLPLSLLFVLSIQFEFLESSNIWEVEMIGGLSTCMYVAVELSRSRFLNAHHIGISFLKSFILRELSSGRGHFHQNDYKKEQKK